MDPAAFLRYSPLMYAILRLIGTYAVVIVLVTEAVAAAFPLGSHPANGRTAFEVTFSILCLIAAAYAFREIRRREREDAKT